MTEDHTAADAEESERVANAVKTLTNGDRQTREQIETMQDMAFRHKMEARQQQGLVPLRRGAVTAVPAAASNWAAYVKKRLLVQKVATSLEVSEVFVVELAPSGTWVKFAWGPEAESWENPTDYRVVEELPPAIDPEKLARGSNVVAAAWWKRDDYTFRRIYLPSDLVKGAPAPVEQVMDEWDFKPTGILFGMNSDGVPLPDAIKGMGPKNRAEFEQQVSAWFAVHTEEAKA